MLNLDSEYTIKKCVGCGNDFVIPTEMAEDSLYCTDTCEENHSIFKVYSEQPKDGQTCN